MFKNLRKKKKGFTLIELIIVIAIIAVLAAIAIPRFGNATKNAKDNADAANGKNIANAVTMAISEGDSNFDTNITDETAVTEDLLGDYLQSVPTPSAGGKFYITVTNGDVVVYSDEEGTTQVYPKK